MLLLLYELRTDWAIRVNASLYYPKTKCPLQHSLTPDSLKAVCSGGDQTLVPLNSCSELQALRPHGHRCASWSYIARFVHLQLQRSRQVGEAEKSNQRKTKLISVCNSFSLISIEIRIATASRSRWKWDKERLEFGLFTFLTFKCPKNHFYSFTPFFDDI